MNTALMDDEINRTAAKRMSALWPRPPGSLICRRRRSKTGWTKAKAAWRTPCGPSLRMCASDKSASSRSFGNPHLATAPWRICSA